MAMQEVSLDIGYDLLRVSKSRHQGKEKRNKKEEKEERRKKMMEERGEGGRGCDIFLKEFTQMENSR